jgi:hypothetical protein
MPQLPRQDGCRLTEIETMKSTTTKAQKASSTTGARTAILTLEPRYHRSGSLRRLKKPVIHGTVTIGSWPFTMDDGYVVGQMARLMLADRIELRVAGATKGIDLHSAYQHELLRLMKPTEVRFATLVRSGFEATKPMLTLEVQ